MMPAFEICYLEDDGALACAFSVQFDDEMRAKILAHAMKPHDCHTLEVWCGKELVYRRPETAGGVDGLPQMAPARGHERRHQPGFA
jgi:hypothetical protein